MNLKTLLEISHEFGVKASDKCRVLAYAGTVLVWFLRKEAATFGDIPKSLSIALTLLLGSLVWDVLQYVYQSHAWKTIHNEKEALLGTGSEKIFNLPEGPGNESYLIFGAKIGMVVIAYGLIIFNILLH